MMFSIIIPVFNCEKTLQTCVNSVLAQSYQNYELLLIDDGSNDATASICDALASTDARIKAVHQKNGGTSCARNTGIAYASGDYIAFLDNDDTWISDDVLSTIHEKIDRQNCDIICFRTKDNWVNRKDEGGDGSTRAPILPGTFFGDMHELIRQGFYTPAVWSKIIRTSLVRENRVLFPEGMRNEDVDFSCKLLFHANSIDFIDQCFYAWTRGRSASQSSKPISPTIANDLAQIIRDNATAALTLEQNRRAIIEAFLSYPYAVWMTYSRVGSKASQKTQQKMMAPYSYLLQRDGDKRADSVRTAARIIGVPAARFLAGSLANLRAKRFR